MRRFIQRIITTDDLVRHINRLRRNTTPWVRVPLGVLLCTGGVLGFLPILGFWMLPLGLGVLAVDWPPARRLVEKILGEPLPLDGEITAPPVPKP
jgi:hypothetical protein